jgi:hypothetical protein
VAGFFEKGISSFFNIQFGLIGTGADIIWKVLTWLWKTIGAGGNLTIALAFLLGPFGVLLDWLYDVATGKTTIKATIDFALGVMGDVLKWLFNAVTSGIKINLDFASNISSALGLGGVSSALSSGGNWLSGAGDWLGNLLHFDNGGIVPGSGAKLAVVHGGETVTPAGQSSGNITIYAPNYVGSKTELMKVVTDALRQNQYRYNV